MRWADDAILCRQGVEFFNRSELIGTNGEFEIDSQVLQRHAGGPAARYGVPGDHFVDVSKAFLPGGFEPLRQIAQVDPFSGGPDRKDKRQARQLPPGVAQVELIVESGRFFTDDFVADEQLGISSLLLAVHEIEKYRPAMVLLGQDDAGQCDGCMTVRIAGKGLQLFDRNF